MRVRGDGRVDCTMPRGPRLDAPVALHHGMGSRDRWADDPATPALDLPGRGNLPSRREARRRPDPCALLLRCQHRTMRISRCAILSLELCCRRRFTAQSICGARDGGARGQILDLHSSVPRPWQWPPWASSLHPRLDSSNGSFNDKGSAGEPREMRSTAVITRFIRAIQDFGAECPNRNIDRGSRCMTRHGFLHYEPGPDLTESSQCRPAESRTGMSVAHSRSLE